MKYEYERIWNIDLSIQDVQMLMYTTSIPPVVAARKKEIAEQFQFDAKNSTYQYQRFATYDKAYNYFHDANAANDVNLIRMTVMAPQLVGLSLQTGEHSIESLVQYMLYGGGLEFLKSRYGGIETVTELEDTLLQLARSNGRYITKYGLDFKLMDLYDDLFVASYREDKFDDLDQALNYVHDKDIQNSARITRAVILARYNVNDLLINRVGAIQPVLQYMNQMYNVRRVTDFERQVLKFLQQRGRLLDIPDAIAMKIVRQAMYVKHYDLDQEQAVAQVVQEMFPHNANSNTEPALNPSQPLLEALFGGSGADRPTGGDTRVPNQPRLNNEHNGNRFASLPSQTPHGL